MYNRYIKSKIFFLVIQIQNLLYYHQKPIERKALKVGLNVLRKTLCRYSNRCHIIEGCKTELEYTKSVAYRF